MAPSVPPAADAPRPLPRRSSAALRPLRPPRLVPLDGLWIALLTLLTLTSAVLFSRPVSLGWLGAASAAATAALLYLLGWRARDRAAGVIAAVLLAASPRFLALAVAVPHAAVFALITVAALLAFVAGSSLAALTLAGLACAARPDAVLLGVVLLALALSQRRRRAWLGAGAFILLAALGLAAQYGFAHHAAPHLTVAARPWLPLWAVTSGMAFVTWLLLPFCAELGEAPRRARWLPVVLWVLTYGIVESVVRVSGKSGMLFGLTPFWFALAGGGLSRLLPALTGEFPRPWVRYGLATLALLSLVAMRLHAEWLHPAHFVAASPVSVKPAPIPVKPTPAPARAMPIPVKPVTPEKPATPAAKPAAKTMPKPAVKPVPVTHTTFRSYHSYRHFFWRRRI